MSENIEKILSEILLEKHGDASVIAEDSIITANSEKVVRGAIFAAVKGTKTDGNCFIDDALRAGASAIIHTCSIESPCDDAVFFKVTDSRKALSLLIRGRCGDPDKKLKIFGITGTNGKTTSAYLIRHILNGAGIPCGLVSTVEYSDGINSYPPTHTTPDPQTLFPLLKAMHENDLHAAAMEFSSHSLAQGRLYGIQLNGAIFTNLTGDHLDFHKDMESYYLAKKSLFTDLLISGGVAAINIDTPYGQRLADELAAERPDLKIPTFGRSENAGWRISEAESSADGCSFVLSNALQAYQTSFPLSGDYNISNLAGVLTLLLCSGISPENIGAALEKPLCIPGRLEKLTSPNGADFFVDYAHTDDALANVLSAVKKFCRGRLIAVFGAGGDRDASKRPRMGSAAAEIADKIILTSDNPRSEDPKKIIGDIAAGIPENCDFELIVSREDALKKAVMTAVKGDIVVVAGKGHENYQEIKGIKYHFDDREILKMLFNGKI